MRGSAWGQGLSIGLFIGLLLGVALAASFQAWLSGDALESPASTRASDAAAGSEKGAGGRRAGEATNLAERLASLQLRLDREQQRRLELEVRLEELAASEPDPAAAGGSTAQTGTDAAGAEGRVGDHWIDEDLLEKARFSRSEIAALRERFESIELEKLYLRDRATREGWLMRPRYARAMREIDAGYSRLRDEYGDEAYDWILFASGRPNRVVVQQVMDASQAASAGIQPGDVILGYDEKRVYDMRALQRSTTEGAPGETTAVDLLRDGERLRVYVPRGPLGVALLMKPVEPEPLY